MARLVRVDSVSLGIVMGLLCGLVSLFIGIIVLTFVLFVTPIENWIPSIGLILLVIPLFYGLVAFIGWLVIAELYNVIAWRFGGVRFVLKGRVRK